MVYSSERPSLFHDDTPKAPHGSYHWNLQIYVAVLTSQLLIIAHFIHCEVGNLLDS